MDRTPNPMDLSFLSGQTSSSPSRSNASGRQSTQGSPPGGAAAVKQTDKQTEEDKKKKQREFQKSAVEYPPHLENKRWYHGFHKRMYMFPCDEQEQDRLDIFHKLFSVAREKHGVDSLHKVPIKAEYSPTEARPRILDLGCGTGIWAINMANRFPNGFVLGIDLAPMQPPNLPHNCEIHAPRDYESPWTLGDESWDMIHLRMGCGSVGNWHNLYGKVMQHLQPGGYFEQVEIRFEPLTEDGVMTGQPLSDWYDALRTATAKVCRSIEPNRNTALMLQGAGFVHVEEKQIRLPLNTWPANTDEKDIGKWYNLAFSESTETLLMAPLTRVSHWTKERVTQVAREATQQAYDKGCEAWNTLHIYTAQKPQETDNRGGNSIV